MKRLNFPNFKNINDSDILDNLVIRDNINSFEYSSWRRDLEFNSSISLTGSLSDKIKEKLKFPQTYFLNGNIILNDASSSSSNESGLFISKGINLLLSNVNKKTAFNELGVEKRILKVGLSGTPNNIYIYKNNNDNEAIGEIIYKDDTGLWIELYLSTTSLNTNDVIYFSNSPNNEVSIVENLSITSIQSVDYSNVPIFKQLKITSKIDSRKNLYHDIGEAYYSGDVSSNKIDVVDISATTIEASKVHADLKGDTEGHHTGDVLGNLTGNVSGTVSNLDNFVSSTVAFKDLILSGNLTVNGETTTINTSNLDISDNIIGLHTVENNDSGIIIKRTTDVSNVFMGWDNTHQYFKLGLTDASANETGVISVSHGLLAADISGNATTATQLQTSVTVGGVAFDGTTNIDLSGVNTEGNQNTTGNAATATQLQTPIKIGGVDFDGSVDIDLSGVNIIGNQDTTGNAATATQFQNSRTIGGVHFDGTTNINLPGVNTIGNQNTTGNAATATKLQNNPTIGGILFNGSENISLPGVNIQGNQDTIGNAATASVANFALSVSGENVIGYVANATNATNATNAIAAQNATNAVVATTANSVNGSNIAGTIDGSKITGTVANATNATNAYSVNASNINGSISGLNISGPVSNASNASNATNGAFSFTNSGQTRRIKLENGTLKFEKEPNQFEAFGTGSGSGGGNVDDIKNVLLTLKSPSAPRDISAIGQENSDYTEITLTVTWTIPLLSDQLNDTPSSGNISEYIVELSKDPSFNTIQITKSGITGTSYSFTRDNTGNALRCSGYYIRVTAKNSSDRSGEYGVLTKNGQPQMVSSGNNCYEYVDQASWNELPDNYKEDIETIVFKEATIPTDALNYLGVQPQQDFTIIIESTVNEISVWAFRDLNYLKKVVIKESSSTLNLNNFVFFNSYNLSRVEIHRTLNTGWHGWFQINTSPSGAYGISSVNMTFTTNSGANNINDFSNLAGDGNNRTQETGVIVTLKNNDTAISNLNLTNGHWYGTVNQVRWSSGSYEFNSHTFTTAGTYGPLGPTLDMLKTEYSTKSWAQNTNYLNMTIPGMQLWTVPISGVYTIECRGSAGGSCTNNGTPTPEKNNNGPGFGYQLKGDFTLTKGEKLQIVVGQRNHILRYGNNGAGGGGASYVFKENSPDPLIIAAGGNGESWESHSFPGPHGQGYGIGSVVVPEGGSAPGRGQKGASWTTSGAIGNGSQGSIAYRLRTSGQGGMNVENNTFSYYNVPIVNSGDTYQSGGFGGGGATTPYEGGGGGGYYGGYARAMNHLTVDYPNSGATSYIHHSANNVVDIGSYTFSDNGLDRDGLDSNGNVKAQGSVIITFIEGSSSDENAITITSQDNNSICYDTDQIAAENMKPHCDRDYTLTNIGMFDGYYSLRNGLNNPYSGININVSRNVRLYIIDIDYPASDFESKKGWFRSSNLWTRDNSISGPRVNYDVGPSVVYYRDVTPQDNPIRLDTLSHTIIFHQ